jgi:hypothetical protein
MFREKTVFILGAGASWHYGYPTGEDLVSRVSGKARELAKFFRTSEHAQSSPKIVDAYYSAAYHPDIVDVSLDIARKCIDIATRLARSQPPVIDYFLAHNPDLREIGKFLIAWVILECEARHQDSGTNHNRPPTHIDNTKDNWSRYLLYKLMSECSKPSDLCANNVKFVTFNYDISLELKIYDGLAATSFFYKDNNCISEFFGSDRFHHVYGSVREYPPSELATAALLLDSNDILRGDNGQQQNQKALLDSIYDASQRICTIETFDKALNQSTIDAAAQAIDEARHVYILGYGFDKQNSERLRLNDSLYKNNEMGSLRTKSIVFTNYHDRNQVNKRASQLFFRTSSDLLANQPNVYGSTDSGFYIEKSIRQVYEALELDFDL